MRWLLAFLTLAQSQFDVVSVKPSAPDDRNGLNMQTQPGGIRFTGVPLRMIMMVAYDLKAFQISGGPDWIRTERWDVQANIETEGRLSMDQKRPMIQALIADRFALKAHKETREMPVYALIVDKKGSKLTPYAGAESQVRNGTGSLLVRKIGMVWFTEWLSRKLGRVVIDQTGLKDEYDFALDWAPDPEEGNPDYTGMPPSPSRARMEKSGPSIFTAIQEQLGLRLVSQKGPVEIVIIDSVEKPSAN
jgi:bla regulator protein BlaR1